MIRKIDLFNRVVELRKLGLSYKEIVKKVNIGSGTISRWCKDVVLTNEQKNSLISKAQNNGQILYKKNLANISRKNAEDWAKKTSRMVNKSEEGVRKSIWICSALYWAEGTKSEDRGLCFTNTDPEMIILMIDFFKRVLKIPDFKIKALVRIGENGNVAEAQRYWSNMTEISLEKFDKAELLRINPKSNSLNKYPNGILRVMVHDVDSSRKMLRLIEYLYKKPKENKITSSPRSLMD